MCVFFHLVFLFVFFLFSRWLTETNYILNWRETKYHSRNITKDRMWNPSRREVDENLAGEGWCKDEETKIKAKNSVVGKNLGCYFSDSRWQILIHKVHIPLFDQLGNHLLLSMSNQSVFLSLQNKLEYAYLIQTIVQQVYLLWISYWKTVLSREFISVPSEKHEREEKSLRSPKINRHCISPSLLEHPMISSSYLKSRKEKLTSQRHRITQRQQIRLKNRPSLYLHSKVSL